MNKAVIILAGGLSKRFGEDKCLKKMVDKPLVAYVLNRVLHVANERVIVVGSDAQKTALSNLSSLNTTIVVDTYEDHSPLVGALTGFETVEAEHALLLPCDAAFVAAEVATLLLDLCVGRSAVIPRWPDGKVEPLQAAYNARIAADAARKALNEGKSDMLSMIEHLHRIRYVSTLVLQQYDEKLTTFFNINTVLDWKKGESMLKRPK